MELLIFAHAIFFISSEVSTIQLSWSASSDFSLYNSHSKYQGTVQLKIPELGIHKRKWKGNHVKQQKLEWILRTTFSLQVREGCK